MFMDYIDIKNKPVKDLQELLSEKREELREFYFKASERQLKNIRDIREAKKTIARILTILKIKHKETKQA